MENIICTKYTTTEALLLTTQTGQIAVLLVFGILAAIVLAVIVHEFIKR